MNEMLLLEMKDLNFEKKNIIIRDDEIEDFIIRDDNERNEKNFLRHEKRFVEIDELNLS